MIPLTRNLGAGGATLAALGGVLGTPPNRDDPFSGGVKGPDRGAPFLPERGRREGGHDGG